MSEALIGPFVSPRSRWWSSYGGRWDCHRARCRWTTWERLGEFTDQPEIQAAATTSARYVRFRVTANQGDWAIVRGFGATTTN